MSSGEIIYPAHQKDHPTEVLIPKSFRSAPSEGGLLPSRSSYCWKRSFPLGPGDVWWVLPWFSSVLSRFPGSVQVEGRRGIGLRTLTGAVKWQSKFSLSHLPRTGSNKHALNEKLRFLHRSVTRAFPENSQGVVYRQAEAVWPASSA